MERKQTKIWTTKYGRKIRICDMTDLHLLNTIRSVVRNGVVYLCSLWSELVIDAQRRGLEVSELVECGERDNELQDAIMDFDHDDFRDND